jgi:CrcB protein
MGLLIALGGALGTLLRWNLGGWIQQRAGTGFPWGTLVINVTGTLVLAFAVRFLEAVAAPAEWRGFVAIGLCGGYTTFSTFGWESMQLLQGGQWARATAYIMATVLLGLGATLIGMRGATLALSLRGG